MADRAYVPRRKRRRTEPTAPSSASEEQRNVEASLHDASAEQEAAWARQERGIVVEGDGPIPAAVLRFESLPLSPDTIRVLQSRGVTTPSAVQAQTLPCMFQGRDVVALAPTGSGKTLCYILPILHLLGQQQQSQATPWFEQYQMPAANTPATPCALVIVPTRELVDQVVQDLSAFFLASASPPVVGLCGGIPLDGQIQQLWRHVNNTLVVVATPGRLLHVVEHRPDALSLSQIALLAIDEVDRVLQEPEMEAQLRRILQFANTATRQTLLLSATLPAFLPRLARSAVLKPLTIRVDEAKMPPKAPTTRNFTHNKDTSSSLMSTLSIAAVSRVTHEVQFMRPAEKSSRLLRVLRMTKCPPVLVFCNSRASVERVARLLHNEQFHVAPLHGDQSQGYRTQALRAFRAGYVDVLVATDLASRGLDLPGVDHVVLYDMPLSIEDYIHRCGRTGRHPGGDTGEVDVLGKATSFLTRECVIAAELKQVLRAAVQPVPRELELPRLFQQPAISSRQIYQ